MKRIVILSLLLSGCVNDGSKFQISAADVHNAALIACALAPTVQQIAALYTQNPDVTTAEQAAAILCRVNAAIPVSK